MGVVALFGCEKKAEPTTVQPTTFEPTTTAEPTLSYDFVIYEKDSDNTDLSDNTVVATYHISYKASESTTVTDTLIKGEGNKYYFVQGGTDYLILEDSAYGLSYTEGYFENYSECANNTQINVFNSLTTVNGEMASTGIGTTPLTGLTTYGFVINAWSQN